MANYITRKSALAVVFLLVIVTSGRAQTAPTAEQVEFASALIERIRAATKAETDALKNQLQPSIENENKVDQARLTLERDIAALAGRTQALSWAATNCPALRPAAQQALNEASEKSKELVATLNKTNADFHKADASRVAAAEAAAWQLGNGTRLTTDLDDLYKSWRTDPPQYTWPAMLAHLIDVARAKKIKSKVTISTGAATAPVKYQLVSGGAISSATNSAPIQLDPGFYKFWIDKPELADAAKTCGIFREAHSIDLKTNQCH
jgi:hypothetical protein